MSHLLYRWGNAVHRYRLAIVIVWVILIAGGAFFGGKLNGILSGGGWDVEGSHNERAQTAMNDHLPGRAETSLSLVVHSSDSQYGDEKYNQAVQQLINQLREDNQVQSVLGIDHPNPAIAGGFVSEDQRTSVATVLLKVSMDHASDEVLRMQKELKESAKAAGVEAYLVGTPAYYAEMQTLSQEGLAKAEMIVFPLIILILLLVFRTLVATATPFIITLASVMVSMGIIYWVAREVELSVFVTNSATMLGLGVGIDYSLFLVSRFKQELERQSSVQAAIATTMSTAGHTVLFSAITVIASMSALFVVELSAIRAIAFGGALVVLVAGLASLTLLPAVLSMLGKRINKGYVRIPFLSSKLGSTSSKVSGWQRWARMMMRKPVLFLVITVAALLIMAIPTLDMKTGNPDLTMMPEDSDLRVGVSYMAESFGEGATSPISVVLQLIEGTWTDPANWAAANQLQQRLAEQPHVKSVGSLANLFAGMPADDAAAALKAGAMPADLQPVIDQYLSQDQKTIVLDVISNSYAASKETKALVESIRDKVVAEASLPEGTAYAIGGETIQGLESSETINEGLLPALLIMLGLIYVILLISFRSVLLPLKAILMNLISVGATYGILVFVMGQGHGAELFGVNSDGTIANFVPVLLLALLFGLSTDYEVFLISRVKEDYEATGNNEESLARGIEETGPLITGAAVLMIAVFVGFAFSGVLPITMLGFGMAVAILLDATIVRMVLVPVSMKLLGRLNWWFPGSKPIARKSPHLAAKMSGKPAID